MSSLVALFRKGERPITQVEVGEDFAPEDAAESCVAAWPWRSKQIRGRQMDKRDLPFIILNCAAAAPESGGAVIAGLFRDWRCGDLEAWLNSVKMHAQVVG